MIDRGRAPATYSIRYLMMLVAAMGVGLAITRFPPFSVTDGFFAAASILVLIGLYSEAMHIRQRRGIGAESSFSRKFHMSWRLLLALAIITYFAIALVRATPGFMVKDYMFEGAAAAPEVMLQLAFVSCLMFHEPFLERRGFGPWIWTLLMYGLGVVLCSLILYWSSMPLFMLIQIALESVERSSSLSQYEPGWTYSGLDPDIKRRTLHFAAVSTFGIVPLLLLAPTITRVASKVRQRQPATSATWLMCGLLAASSVYPIWLYTGGLWHFSPAFAEASFRLSLTSWIAAGLCIIMLATLLTYRMVRCESENANGGALTADPLWFARRHIVTLVILTVAALSWIAEYVNQFFALAWWQILPELAAHPRFYMALVILWILAMRLWPNNKKHIAPGDVEPRAFALVWPTVAMTLILSAPTLWWFVYSIGLVYVYQLQS